MRNISFALTTSQFLDGSQDVTRRMGWKKLGAGDKLCAVKKGMGLKPGEKIERLGYLQVVSVRRERLDAITYEDVRREGFGGWLPERFIKMFCESHKGCKPDSTVTRIEFVRQDADGRDIIPNETQF